MLYGRIRDNRLPAPLFANQRREENEERMRGVVIGL